MTAYGRAGSDAANPKAGDQLADAGDALPRCVWPSWCQLSVHTILPVFIGQVGSNQQVTPVSTAEHHCVIQPAQISLSKKQSSHLNSLDSRRVASFTRKHAIGEPSQGCAHPVGVMGEVNPNTALHTLGNTSHGSRSHAHRTVGKTQRTQASRTR